MNTALLTPHTGPATAAHAARPATPANADPASDDSGGFAAALDAAFTQAGPAEAHADARAQTATAVDAAVPPEQDPGQAAATATPAADLAQWLPGWPPAASPAAAAGTALPADVHATSEAVGERTGPTHAMLPPALAAPAARSVAAPLTPATSTAAVAAEQGIERAQHDWRAGDPAPGMPAAAARPATLPAGALAAPAARSVAAPLTPATSTAAAAAEPGIERTQHARRADDPTPGVPAAAARPTETATTLPWPATMGLASRESGPTTSNVGASPAAPFEARLAAALDSAAFGPALATQIKWLVHEGVQHARLLLNPAEMGPLAVKIVLDGTQARVDFSAEMAATRAAIEASLPTLAAALHDSGLTLAGGGVFDGQARHGAQAERGMRAPGPGSNAAASAVEAAALPVRVARGLVDLVA